MRIQERIRAHTQEQRDREKVMRAQDHIRRGGVVGAAAAAAAAVAIMAAAIIMAMGAAEIPRVLGGGVGTLEAVIEPYRLRDYDLHCVA